MAKIKRKKRFAYLKKSIKSFVKDEDGFVAKKNILKIGLGTISALAIINSVTDPAYGQISRTHKQHDEGNSHDDAYHHSDYADHDNSIQRENAPAFGATCYRLRHFNDNVQFDHNSGPGGGK